MDDGGSVNANGVVELENLKASGSADLAGGVITNQGQINSPASGGGGRTIGAAILNDGGSLTLGASVTTFTGTFTNESGNLTVSAPTTDLTPTAVFSDDRFNEDNGTTTGAPILEDATLALTGTGASSFVLEGDCTLDGSEAAGQTVTVQGGAFGGSSTADLTANFTNAGTIALASAPDGDYASLSGDFTFTNTGTLSTTAGTGTLAYLESNIVNEGTITLDAVDNIFNEGNALTNTSGSITTGTGAELYTGSGTFTQGGGTVSGPAPIIQGTLDVTGSGAGSFTLVGGTTLEGATAAGQTVTVLANQTVLGNSIGESTASISGSFTNGGTLVLDPSTNADYADVNGGGTLTNTGTIETVANGAGTAYIEINTVNEGTMTLDSVETAFDEDNSLTNTSGAITTGAGAGLYMEGGTFTQGAGTVSGPAPVIQGTLDITGSGAGSFTLTGGTTLQGATAAGQMVTELADDTVLGDTDGSSTITVIGAFTNGGTLVLDSPNPSDYADINGSGILTNTGTIETVKNGTGEAYIEVNTVNQGTMTLDAPLNSFDEDNSLTNTSGTIALGTGAQLLMNGNTFTQGAGTVTGGAPLINGTLDVTGNGAGSFTLEGSPTLAGKTVAGQTVTVQSTVTTQTTLNLASNVTNGGTLVFDSSSKTDYTNVNSAFTLTNTGTLTTVQDKGGTRYFEAPIVNKGTMNLDANLNYFDEGQSLTNGSATAAATLNLGPSSELELTGSGVLTLGADGTLTMAIKATAPTSNSSIVAATAKIAGTLGLTTTGTPADPTSYKLIKATSLSGTFATINYTGVTYTPTYAVTGVTFAYS